MYENIKEIYVGVVESRNKKGEKISGRVFLEGRPVTAGVYTATSPPSKPNGDPWGWGRFCRMAIPHDDHGIKITYSRKVKEVKSDGGNS